MSSNIMDPFLPDICALIFSTFCESCLQSVQIFDKKTGIPFIETPISGEQEKLAYIVLRALNISAIFLSKTTSPPFET